MAVVNELIWKYLTELVWQVSDRPLLQCRDQSKGSLRSHRGILWDAKPRSAALGKASVFVDSPNMNVRRALADEK